MRTLALLAVVVFGFALPSEAADPPRYEAVAALLKTHCVKCHGPAKREGGLNLATAAGVRKGSKEGPVVTAHDLAASSLWGRVAADEMPPEEPLGADEKGLLKAWIEAGAPGLPANVSTGDASDHWAFRGLVEPQVPSSKTTAPDFNTVDRFLESKLEEQGLSLGEPVDRGTLLRRLSLVLTGLPPTLAELDAFLDDKDPRAVEHAVDRYLASPHFGERWGKYWLDAAGYSDSNGYFNADSDRPIAWRYRDWVVRAFNADLPFDQFVRMQIAGDELARHVSGEPATQETIDLLTATHYLRNGQDGTGESDGNPDEVKADKYFALESCQQNVVSSLLGLTIQCAKCHDHKFEPITQLDFYRLQAVFYPAFPIENWKKPNERFVYAPPAGETERWKAELDRLTEESRTVQREFKEVVRKQRPRGEILFSDTFENGVPLAPRWSNTAPGDDTPAGKVPVRVDSTERPGAFVREGALVIAEGNTQGDSALCTSTAFDWTPAEKGASIQVTFDLVANRFDEQGAAAERIGYLLALHDFDDSSAVAGGNILVDGHPTTSTAVHLDYPGTDSKSAGVIGTTGYAPGRNYGVRITALGEGKYRLEHLVDFIPEEKTIDLVEADLPNGGFAFEYCCNRSFVVDNVVVEKFPPTESSPQLAEFVENVKARKKKLTDLEKQRKDLEQQQPGKLAWTTDLAAPSPEVHLLIRGNYSTPGDVVTPGAFAFLTDAGQELQIAVPEKSPTTGTRLAFADWVTRRSPRAQALLARAQTNRMWQHTFGSAIVTTTENLGYSGSEPSHVELLDWLAARFIPSGFRHKAMLKELVLSRAFRQSSATHEKSFATDPGNRLLWRFPPVRLDAEAVRDTLLAVSGSLDPTIGGPYVASTRIGTGEVVVPESDARSRRRALYMYQRRTQIVSMLQLFDAPQIVFNSTRRPRSTIPLQSLSLLNGEFAVARARELAERVTKAAPDDPARIETVWRLCYSRPPQLDERADALRFLEEQTQAYGDQTDGRQRAWRDLCQSLLAGSETLYLK
ncbi:MAG: PSD1 and planctomycete cytochrome C domain-containing protein [Planctomycetota bacterium]|nr:PSD1 and planctomycete cytochrome C domain-containing protein [Planctomycetota bacterium]